MKSGQVYQIPSPDKKDRGLFAGELKGRGHFQDEITLSEASGISNPPVIDISYPPPSPPSSLKRLKEKILSKHLSNLAVIQSLPPPSPFPPLCYTP